MYKNNMNKIKHHLHNHVCVDQCVHSVGEEAAMCTVKEVLLKEMKKLKAEEFNDFRFYLQEYGCKAKAALI